jgi:hypothetical protein
MIRFLQAYESVKDTQNLYPVERTLTVLRPVVQIRLSVLVATVVILLIVVMIAIIERLSEPFDQSGQRLKIPVSLLGWMVQASQEHFRGTDVEVDVARSPTNYASLHKDLDFTTSTTPDGHATFVVIWAERLERQAEQERQQLEKQSEDERQQSQDE